MAAAPVEAGGAAQPEDSKKFKKRGALAGASKDVGAGAGPRTRTGAADGTDSVDSATTSESGSERDSSASDLEEAGDAPPAGAGAAVKHRAAHKRFKAGVFVPHQAVAAVAASETSAVEIAPGVTLHGLRRGAALSLNGAGAAHAACVTVASGSVSLYSDANRADVFELAAGGLFLTQGAAVTVVGKAADTVVVAHGVAAAE